MQPAFSVGSDALSQLPQIVNRPTGRLGLMQIDWSSQKADIGVVGFVLLRLRCQSSGKIWHRTGEKGKLL